VPAHLIFSAASNGRKDTVLALIKLQPDCSSDSSSSSSSSNSSSSLGLKHLTHTLSFTDPEHAAQDIATVLFTSSSLLQVRPARRIIIRLFRISCFCNHVK
jgi:hypothetical protein